MTTKTISVPAALAERVEGYLRQQKELQLAIQITVDTAAEVLSVPAGWRYDQTVRAFTPQGEVTDGSNN